MVSTNDRDLYETARMFRSHGMVREAASETLKRSFSERYPDMSRTSSSS